MGGITGGFLYSKLDLKLNALLLGALILIISLVYDDFRLRIITAKRRYKQRRTSSKTSGKRFKTNFYSKKS
jgi:hypothetical protein